MHKIIPGEIYEAKGWKSEFYLITENGEMRESRRVIEGTRKRPFCSAVPSQ